MHPFTVLFCPVSRDVTRFLATDPASCKNACLSIPRDRLRNLYSKSNSWLMMLIAYVLAACFLLASSASAAQVTLAWDPNQPAPDGYRLYQRSANGSYDYNNPVWTGSGTTTVVDNLADDATYYFVVRAYNGGAESSDSNEVSYTAPPAPAPVNQVPTANAGGDQTVPSEALVTLNGSGSSDPDGDALSYSWVQSSGTAVVFSTVTNPSFTFTAPAVSSGSEVLIFTLTVTDGSGATDSDQCRITVEAPATANQAPVAEAGPNRTVASQSRVTLDGSGSSDPENQPLAYQWRQTRGTAVSISNANSARARFTAPAADQLTTLVFELTVTDTQNLTSTDTCLVSVEPQTVADSDGDGVDDAADAFPNDPGEWDDTDQDGTGNNTDTDDDNDGMPDQWETQYGLDPLSNDADQDTDSDGISNLEEYQAGSNPTVDEGNESPDQPVITSPTDGAQVESDKLRIQASAFADPDEGDQHGSTQWQIVAQDGALVVLDVKVQKRFLESLRVPRMVLDPDTAYICKVRYFDNKGQASEWSQAVAFSTNSRTEHSAVSSSTISTDLNHDNTDDGLQDGLIQTTDSPSGTAQMGVSIENCQNATQISAIDAFDPQTFEDGAPFDTQEMPYGMLGYKIQVPEPGQTVNILLLYSEPVDTQTQWYRYNSIADWQSCSEGIESAEPGNNGIERLITDGGEYDADGVANGIIVELMGPRTVADPETTPDTDADSGLLDGTSSGQAGSGSGCFLQSLSLY